MAALVAVDLRALKADPRFQATVDERWEEMKKKIKDDARQVVPEKRLDDQYVNLMRRYNSYLDAKDGRKWSTAMLNAHTYIELALRNRLHIPADPKYKKFGDEVRETLSGLADKMELVLEGLKSQLEFVLKEEIEKALKEGAATSPLVTSETWAALRGGNKVAGYPSLDVSKKVAAAFPVEEPQVQAKRFSAEQVRGALDALRIDGKKTNLKLYGMNIGSPTKPKPMPHPSAPSDTVGVPPPSYQAASNSGGVRDAKKQRESLSVRASSFRIKRVPGDGSCAFRSIAQGLNDGRLNPTQELANAKELRKIAVDELRRCADEEMTGTGLSVEQITLMKDSKYPTYSEYINAMSRSEYAGETEFWLLSRKLGINIAIYQPNGASYEHLITYGSSNAKTANLLWQRGKTEAGNHYDCCLE